MYQSDTNVGERIYALASELWPINRSLTGDGVRETLERIKQHIPCLKMHEVASGTPVFDWIIPKEWAIREAWIRTPDGQKICNFSDNNVHIVGYSAPIHTKISLNELQKHLYSLPENPDAIPYVTSYYQERWGFCLSENQRQRLTDGIYDVYIDSELFDGRLTYGEILLPGQVSDEIFLSTYICHPSLANNELSGPCVTTFLASWLADLTERYFSYRIVFIPETIGSLTYLSRHKDVLKERVFAGFNITCVGDDRAHSFLPSRQGTAPSDKIGRHILTHMAPDFVTYGWKDRGSDERQYCAPHIDLPVTSLMRTKYGEYQEYHTSLDQLGTVVTPQGLYGGYIALRRSLEAIEKNGYPVAQTFGEPQMGKRNLYPTLSQRNSGRDARLMMDVLTWADGNHDLIDIAEKCELPVWDLYPITERLIQHNLITLSKGFQPPQS